jgi:hypothetical protein
VAAIIRKKKGGAGRGEGSNGVASFTNKGEKSASSSGESLYKRRSVSVCSSGGGGDENVKERRDSNCAEDDTTTFAAHACGDNGVINDVSGSNNAGKENEEEKEAEDKGGYKRMRDTTECSDEREGFLRDVQKDTNQERIDGKAGFSVDNNGEMSSRQQSPNSSIHNKDNTKKRRTSSTKHSPTHIVVDKRRNSDYNISEGGGRGESVNDRILRKQRSCGSGLGNSKKESASSILEEQSALLQRDVQRSPCYDHRRRERVTLESAEGERESRTKSDGSFSENDDETNEIFTVDNPVADDMDVNFAKGNHSDEGDRFTKGTHPLYISSSRDREVIVGDGKRETVRLLNVGNSSGIGNREIPLRNIIEHRRRFIGKDERQRRRSASAVKD